MKEHLVSLSLTLLGTLQNKTTQQKDNHKHSFRLFLNHILFDSLRMKIKSHFFHLSTPLIKCIANLIWCLSASSSLYYYHLSPLSSLHFSVLQWMLLCCVMFNAFYRGEKSFKLFNLRKEEKRDSLHNVVWLLIMSIAFNSRNCAVINITSS